MKVTLANRFLSFYTANPSTRSVGVNIDGVHLGVYDTLALASSAAADWMDLNPHPLNVDAPPALSKKRGH